MSAFIFFRQVSFMNHFDWGFKKDGLIKITMEHRDRARIVENIKQLALVQEFIPTGIFNIKTEPRVLEGEIKWIEKPAGLNPIIEIEDVGRNFINGFGIPMIKGRFFEDEDIVSEETARGIRLKSNKAVVNQEMERIMGKENVIGETIEIPAGWISSDGTIGMKTMEIIGIVRNFHTLSLQKPVYPLILQIVSSESDGYFNYIRVAKGTENQTIAAIKEVFKNCSSPGDPDEVDIISMPQLLNNFCKSEKASLQLFSVLAALCIIISIFGIYSISSSNMERRKKEIAIRKVHGATATEIVMMFIKEYSIILFFANLIALPPALYFMNLWLAQYANHTSIHIWMVVLVVIATFVLVVSTVLAQVIEAANRNPAEVVKSE
jgi:ABC-type antimicrobial peptide transport system permease subunit